MQVNFLQAAIPLVKELDNTGKTIASYPLVTEFSSLSFEINGIEEFYEAIKLNAELGHCLLKGKLKKQLISESRAGQTDPNEETNWICLDYDGEDAFSSIDDYLNSLGVGGTDYILQYSASAGFTSTTNHKCHVFMLLTNPTDPGIIKRWTTSINLDNPIIRQKVRLDKTDNSLLWALDTSTGQNDKLIFIAPPKCSVDPIKDRIQLHKRNHRSIDFIPLHSAELLQAKKDDLINALRQIKGLPKRKKQATTSFGGTEVLKGCPPCNITGHKIERGFHRININGGTSWGYYFPENNIEVVYNFRGEPNVLLKELAPEFYAKLKGTETSSLPIKALVIHDPETDSYWTVKHDLDNNLLEAHTIASKDRGYDFLAQFGISKPPFIPDWRIALDPRKGYKVDYENKCINLFRPTEYLLAEPDPSASIPPTIEQLIRHLCVDDATFNHFINWLACVFQTRTRAGTAWVFLGTYGTGKGVLFHRILSPMFGHRHSTIITIANLEDQFNSFLENTIILFVDEANLADTHAEGKVWNKLKSYITDERMPIRGMKRNMVVRENFMNVIFPTNEYVPLKIEGKDRRINVSPRQENPLQLTRKQIEEDIPNELMEFCKYLAAFKVDKTQAATPIKNAARENLIKASKNTVDLFFTALRNGDLQYLLNFIDDSPGALANAAYLDYASIMKKWAKTPTCEISLPEAMKVYKYLHGAKDMTPTKFHRMCSHRQCEFDQHPDKPPTRTITWQK